MFPTQAVLAKLFTEDGWLILDFNSGYCVQNVGHNHSGLVRAIKAEFDRGGLAMRQGHVPVSWNSDYTEIVQSIFCISGS
jgi:4-aminobutyrate aminotransferase-like enzyme